MNTHAETPYETAVADEYLDGEAALEIFDETPEDTPTTSIATSTATIGGVAVLTVVGGIFGALAVTALGWVAYIGLFTAWSAGGVN